jgi:plastocyanin
MQSHPAFQSVLPDMNKTLAISMLAAVVLGVFALAGVSLAQYPQPSTTPQAPTPAPSTVAITGTTTSDYAFAPKTVKIKKGHKVKWAWSSNAPHNVTFGKLNKHSQTTAAGSYGLKFKTPGTYRYFCSVHGFTGKVVVRK